MLLCALRTRPAALFTLSPILWLCAVLPLGGLLAVPVALLQTPVHDAASLAFLAFSSVFIALFAYAFARSAAAQNVWVAREGNVLHIRRRAKLHTLDTGRARLAIGSREHGMSRRVTVHMVLLSGAAGDDPCVLHMGLTRMGARRAARKIAGVLELAAPTD